MNRTKKLTAALLACLMVFLLAVTACKPAQDESSNGRNEARGTTEPAMEPAAEPTPEPEPETEPEQEIIPINTPETVVIDDEYCTFKILGMEVDTIAGNTLLAYMENKTDTRQLEFWIEDAYVNGLRWNPSFIIEVAPGENTVREITFDDPELSELIPVFTDIELHVTVDECNLYDGYEAVVDRTESVHIYPRGEKNAEKFVRETQPTDMVLVDNDRFTFIVTVRDEDGYWPITLKAYLVNRTDKVVMVNVEHARINGIACDPFWAYEMYPGTSSFKDVFWSKADLERSGIDPAKGIEEIEMDLRIYEEDNYGSPIFEGTVTLHP